MGTIRRQILRILNDSLNMYICITKINEKGSYEFEREQDRLPWEGLEEGKREGANDVIIISKNI